MKYVSTRGGSHRATFEDALFSSYCQDGGLYVPESVPKISEETRREWAKLSFVELGQRIARLFIEEEEISTDALNGCIKRAFGSFSHAEVAPMTKLRDGLNILELFHGRTLAFKDIALSCVGEMLEYFLDKRKKHVIIVVVTSGDTGSAAIDSVRGKDWIDIVVFLPEIGCSEVQVLQMTTVIEDNVHVYKVETLDKIDQAMIRVSRDQSFCEQHGFISINSTNWARIMMQIVHYFYGYFQVCPELDEEVEYIVPTGACGDLAAGMYAREMGLPVRFVCAVNSNDMVARALSKGDYSKSTFMRTLAPAMDIQLPFNIERVLYVLSGGDHAAVAKMFTEFELRGSSVFPESMVEKIKSAIGTHTADDNRIKAVIRQCWEAEGYSVCPHTAIGLSCFYSQNDETSNATKRKRVCIATASPAKFPKALTAAGVPPQQSPKLAGLTEKPTKLEHVPGNYEGFMRGVVASIYQKRNKHT